MNTPNIPFVPAPKTPRLNREIIVTEKVDGTRATIFIDDSGELFCGSRNKWITPQEDNYGFARWAEDNREELLKLGPGRFEGEWWGQGIQRNYGLTERRFSLFNVARWVPRTGLGGATLALPGITQVIPGARQADGTYAPSTFKEGPACCHVVPVLWRGNFHSQHIENTLENLRANGSYAAPGFMRPEGIVIYHTASKQLFKATCQNDDKRKSDLTSV
jgi:hypothetical protein